MSALSPAVEPSEERWFTVMTSIFPPTEAVVRFATLPFSKLIVVGDLKSPAAWECADAEFLSADRQRQSRSAFAAALPWNHYSRKMLGYVEAIRRGADFIIDTDDDNLPKPNFDFPPFDLSASLTSRDRGFVNIYHSFTTQKIWPRGFPLRRLADPASVLADGELRPNDVSVGIWQALADGDPDVDAIYRLTDNSPCIFAEREPIVLAPGTLCPFNSQNTAFRKEFFPLLYLPATVTFRFTDILRGLVAQPILWQHGSHLGFTRATVEQLRNPHDYLKDFESEVPCYLLAEKVVETVLAALRPDSSVREHLVQAYAALHHAGVVGEKEMSLLTLWLDEIASG